MTGKSRAEAIRRVACHRIVATAQLREIGLTRHAIDHQVRCGRLYRVHRGVFAIGDPQLSREGRWLAAVLAAGPGAALSFESAAANWALVDGAVLTEVSVPNRSSRRIRSVVVHEPLALDAGDVVTRNGIPTTTLRRTLIDRSTVVDRRRLVRDIAEAERRHRIDLHALRSSLDDAVRPHARLRKTLDAYVARGAAPTESALEDAVFDLCARHRIAKPDNQIRRGRHRIDFVWERERVVLEVDGYESHGTRIAFQEDRARDRRRGAEGYLPLRATWLDVTVLEAELARDLRDNLAARRRLLAPALFRRSPD